MPHFPWQRPAPIPLPPGAELHRAATRNRGGENWRIVGEPGEPAYVLPWFAETHPTAGLAPALRFKIDDLGLVHLSGGIDREFESTFAELIFILPERYRPPKQILISVSKGSAHSARILANGEVRLYAEPVEGREIIFSNTFLSANL